MGPRVRACEKFHFMEFAELADHVHELPPIFRQYAQTEIPQNFFVFQRLMHRLKSNKLSSGSSPNSKATTAPKEPFSLSKSVAFAGLQSSLNVFKEIAGKTGVPGLQEGVQALVIVLAAVQVRSPLSLAFYETRIF